MNPPIVSPWDEYNQELAANVHPPEPASRYNLVAIGAAGTAGLVTPRLKPFENVPMTAIEHG